MKPFELNTTGQCSSCSKKITEEKLQCSHCETIFHATCTTGDPLCTNKTFLRTFVTASTNKLNFSWKCDVCCTLAEADKVATLSQQLSGIRDALVKLTGKTQTVDELKKELKTQMSNEFTLLTESFNSSITSQMREIRSDFQKELEKLNVKKREIQPDDGDSQTRSSNTVWDRKDKVKEMRSSLIAKFNEETQTSLDVDKLEKAAIAHGIPLNSVHVTESGDTFVNLPDKASSDKLQPLLREMNHETVTLKSKLPSVALMGVTRKYSKIEVVETILKQNEVIRSLVEKGSHLSVVYTKEPGEDSTYHQVVLRVSPDIRRAMHNHGNKLHMGKVVHKVVNRFYIRRCNVCQCYGHYQEKCPTPRSPVCGYCSSNEHLSKDCPIKDGPTKDFSCNNCKSQKLEFKGHSTFWHNCSAYKAQQKKLERSIDYDYSNP